MLKSIKLDAQSRSSLTSGVLFGSALVLVLCLSGLVLDQGGQEIARSKQTSQVQASYFQPAYHHGAAASCKVKLSDETKLVPAALRHCYGQSTPTTVEVLSVTIQPSQGKPYVRKFVP